MHSERELSLTLCSGFRTWPWSHGAHLLKQASRGCTFPHGARGPADLCLFCFLLENVLATSDEKAALRAKFRAIRKTANADAGPSLYARAAERFLNGLVPDERAVVAGYWPTGSEFDCRPLMHALAVAGCQLALPRIEDGDGQMSFRLWEEGAPLGVGAHDIPAPEAGAEIVTPDYLIVPLLAADHSGARLGQGGGFYDRALEKLRQSPAFQAAVGLGFEEQFVESLPSDPHDQHIDYMLTPRRLVALNGAAR